MARIILLFVILMVSNITEAQDLDSYRWRNRIILLVANQPGSEIYAKQIEELASKLDGIKERRLIILRIEPDRYSQSLQGNHWRKVGPDLKYFTSTKNSFECILIGLDGGVKMRRSTLVSNADLFALIDGMPMRQQEMRSKPGLQER